MKIYLLLRKFKDLLRGVRRNFDFFRRDQIRDIVSNSLPYFNIQEIFSEEYIFFKRKKENEIDESE